jgi:hypothetical protein
MKMFEEGNDWTTLVPWPRALTLWSWLSRFLDYSELELSNNLAENAMCPVALGRRNLWLRFCGLDLSTVRSLELYQCLALHVSRSGLIREAVRAINI